MCLMTRIGGVDATDPDALTAAELEGRRQSHEYFRFLRDRVPGFERAVLVSTQPGDRRAREPPDPRRAPAHAARTCSAARQFDGPDRALRRAGRGPRRRAADTHWAVPRATARPTGSRTAASCRRPSRASSSPAAASQRDARRPRLRALDGDLHGDGPGRRHGRGAERPRRHRAARPRSPDAAPPPRGGRRRRRRARARRKTTTHGGVTTISNETRTARLGILGSGFVADFYLDGLRDVPGRRRPSRTTRAAPSARSEFGAARGIARQYTEIDALCADDEVDIVVIALPNHLHLDAVRACAAAGRRSSARSRWRATPARPPRWCGSSSDAGVMAGYAETEVFSPNVMRAREMIEAGAIGDVLSVRAREAHSGPHAAHFWDAETGRRRGAAGPRLPHDRGRALLLRQGVTGSPRRSPGARR